MSHNTSSISPEIAWASYLFQFNYLSSKLPLRGSFQTRKYIKDTGELRYGTAANLFLTLFYENQQKDEFSLSLHALQTKRQTMSILWGCLVRQWVELIEYYINIVCYWSTTETAG